MSVFMIIFGVLMVIGGIVCLLTPVATTFSLMYFFMTLMFVTGIVLLIQSIVYRRVMDLIIAILALLAGAFIVFSPNLAFVTETILLYVVACWLIIRGIFGIVNACRAKKNIGGGMFAFALIVSLLTICAGIYSFIHPIIFAGFLGILASCYFIVEGIDMIIAGCIGKDIENTK